MLQPWRGEDLTEQHPQGLRCNPPKTRDVGRQIVLFGVWKWLFQIIPGLACEHLKGAINDRYNDQLDMYILPQEGWLNIALADGQDLYTKWLI